MPDDNVDCPSPDVDLSLVDTAALIDEILSRKDTCIIVGMTNTTSSDEAWHYAHTGDRMSVLGLISGLYHEMLSMGAVGFLDHSGWGNYRIE